MGDITNKFNDVYRDYEVPSIPAAGNHEPRKSEIRALGAMIENEIDALSAGLSFFETKAALDAYTGPKDVLAYVRTGDGAGVYSWNGDSWEPDTAYAQAVATVVQPLVDQAEDARDDILDLKPVIRGTRASIGNMAPYARVVLNAINGAITLGGGSFGPKGLRFTNGNGNGSTIFIQAPLLDADRRIIPVGTKVTVVTAFTVSPGFKDAVGPSNDVEQTAVVFDNDTGTFNGGEVDHELSGFYGDTGYIRATTHVWTADNKRLGQRLQFDQVQPSGGEFDIRVAGLTVLIDELPGNNATTAADLARTLKDERKRLGYAQQFTVGPVPLGNPPTLTTADLSEWLGTRTDETRARLIIPAGSIITNNVAIPAGTDLFGYQRQYAGIVNFLLKEAPAQTIADFEILRLDYSTHIVGTNGYIKNGRYYAHTEGAGQITDQTIRITRVDWRHQGNAEARAYVASQGGNPDTVFASTVPYGIGTGSGNEITVEYSRLRGESGAILWHNNADFERPSPLNIIGDELLPDGLISPFLALTTLGSFVESPVKVIGNTTRGQLTINGASNWVQTDPAKNPADHVRGELDVFGYANSPFGVIVSDPGRCLRIRHATAGAGGLNVSGTVLPRIFGPAERCISRPGAAGYRAAFDGYLDVQGGGYTFAGNAISLGNRLGNRSGSPETLIVDGDGFDPITITFDQDYRGQSHATILAAINAALGGAATASLFGPGETYRPRFTDWEAVMANTGTLTMLAGTMVAYLPGGYVCRPAEPGDELAGSIYKIGLAMEDIVPGALGRIQTAGLANLATLLTDSFDINTVQPGDRFSPVQTGAAVDYNGAKGVLTRRTDGLGALMCVRPKIASGPYNTPAFLLVG